MVRRRSKVRKRVDGCDRDWKVYNGWQSEEVLLACLALRLLVDSSAIHDWERRTGRPRVPRRELVLCLIVRAYFDQRVPHVGRD